MEALFAAERFDRVVHLAAQAGVRYSLDEPARLHRSRTSSASSTSSRAAATIRCSTSSTPAARASTAATRGCRSRSHDNVDHPVSLYAATKKANELMAHTYSHLFGLPTHRAALLHRLRPVGPARHGAVPVHEGDPRRPSRSTSSTTARCSATSPTSTTSSKASCACSTARRSRTPTFDTATPDPAHSAGRRTACSTSATTSRRGCCEYIDALEEALGKKAERNYLPMQPGDVPATFADTTLLTEWTGHKPGTPIREGIGRFVEWYLRYREAAVRN